MQKFTCCKQCTAYFKHTIGSHSDDRGGDSDNSCYCNEDDCRNLNCECHTVIDKNANETINRLSKKYDVDEEKVRDIIMRPIRICPFLRKQGKNYVPNKFGFQELSEIRIQEYLGIYKIRE